MTISRPLPQVGVCPDDNLVSLPTQVSCSILLHVSCETASSHVPSRSGLAFLIWLRRDDVLPWLFIRFAAC